jgi:hypothetical protein
MRTPPVLFLVAALCAPLAARAAVAPRAAAVPPADTSAGTHVREVLSPVLADLPLAASAQHVYGDVVVRALVSPMGIVDSALAVSGDHRLRPAAETAVRWWIFRPGPAREWSTVTVTIPPADAEELPLNPDVVAMARAAEAHGEMRAAVDAWTGALARVGRHSSLRNEWAIREHLLRIARSMNPPPVPANFIAVHARSWHGEQERTVTTQAHAALVESFAEAVNGAPWWPEPYLWRAASLLGAGRLPAALRDLRAYRLGVRDTEGVALADRVLLRLAAGDTLGACEMLKKTGQDHRPENAHE